MNYRIQIQEDQSTCLECGTAISGRKGKKFCCNDCKNIHNNRTNRKNKRYKNAIVSILSKNYSILDKLLQCNISHITKEELADLGYDCRYMTGHNSGKYKHEKCSCFDINYYQSESRIFKIERMALSEELIDRVLVPNIHL